MSKKRKLKNLLINPPFQAAVILYSVGLSFALIGLQFLAVKHFINKYLDEGALLGLRKDHPFYHFIAEQQFYLNRVFLFSSLILLVVTVVFGLVLSHRIAGPIHRLKLYFTQFSNSDSAHLTFRKGDFFQDVPPVVNEALSRKPLPDEKAS